MYRKEKQNLAGVKEIGQPVEHGDGAVFRQLFHAFVAEGAHHDAMAVAGHDPRGVLDGLAAPELRVVFPQDHGVPAQLRDGHLEAHARARGRLLEDEGQHAAGPRRVGLAPAAQEA